MKGSESSKKSDEDHGMGGLAEWSQTPRMDAAEKTVNF